MTREGDQKPKFTEMLCYKDLSVKELQEFLSLTSSMADAERFLSGVLGLDDYTIKPQNAFVLDYCIGILLFGQEAGLGLQQISKIYALGIEILDILSKGGTFEETEVAFQSKMLSLTFSESDQDCLSLLTPADLQKITLHFISTVFQHHALYRFCFTKEHPIKTQSENVYVETAIVPPLWEALIAEEVEEQQKEKLALLAAAELEEKAKQEVAIKAESEALADEKAIKEEEERKHKPANLEDAIELVVREKINEAKKMLTKEFELQEQALLEKLKQV